MSASGGQIRQMVNFILQEAHEKANEIRIKTEHDFNLEKQMIVHNAKLKIQEEYEKKDKNREIQKRIARSAEIGASRVHKMKEREHLMKGLMDQARQKIAKTTSDEKQYSQLLGKLILQALVKIDESNVTVYCRACDLKMVQKAAKGAQSDYIALIKAECLEDVKLNLKVNDDSARMLPPPPSGGPGAYCSGGVRLTACNGKIVCDNTLDTRLKLIYEEQMPHVRGTLFPNSVVVITHAPPKRKEGSGIAMVADE